MGDNEVIVMGNSIPEDLRMARLDLFHKDIKIDGDDYFIKGGQVTDALMDGDDYKEFTIKVGVSRK